MRRQRILVVGGGGREHALVWKLGQSPDVETILVAPGNAGTSKLAENIPIRANDIRALTDLVETRDIDLTVIGPEGPLALGLTDLLHAHNRAVFGPDAASAQLEASKAFAKRVMDAAGVPTAPYMTFNRVVDARAHLVRARYPLVIKADALAAGKGVTICQSKRDGLETLEMFMVERVHGSAGDHVVIEDALEGPEVSLLALVDGDAIVPLPVAQDHKRLRNANQGPNTGGMGAYAPVPFLDSDERARLIDLVMRPVVELMARSGAPYRGVLYAGLMLTGDGPYVLEFNCRFGDPEAQVILPLLDDDLVPWLTAVARGNLKQMPPAMQISRKSAVGVVLAAPGYPAAPRVGSRIAGIPGDEDDIHVFHSGTAIDTSGHVVTAGGRVLTLVGIGDTLEQARQRVHSAPIDFPDMQFRVDIPQRAPSHRARIGVLASGGGSNLQALLDASEAGRIDADVVIVISGSRTSGSLERARRHDIPGVPLMTDQSSKSEDRRTYDRRLLRHLLPFDLDLLVLAGWMRILSTDVLDACPFPVINVHPALLSADGSDVMEIDGHIIPVLRGLGAVRRALAMNLPFTGVTVHHVTSRVDAGPIILRQSVPIEAGDCEATLYQRIKSAEHRLLVEAIGPVLSSAQTGVVHA